LKEKVEMMKAMINEGDNEESKQIFVSSSKKFGQNIEEVGKKASKSGKKQ
jgi:hypothetical protein